MVFVVLTLAVVLASGLLLFNSGMLATKKMQVQNAADAAAYSIALLEARDLNFMAYTNRAVVANEVGIGQMVGLVSWAYYMESVPEFLDFWFSRTMLFDVPVLGTILRILITGLRILGRFVAKVVPRIADPFAKALATMSKIYSNSQYIMHAATAGMSWGVYRDMIAANAPGARPSTYGTLALLAHQGSFYAKYLKRYSQNKTQADQIAGMERLAQVIQDSRDPFLQKRQCGISLRSKYAGLECGEDSGGWDAFLGPFNGGDIETVHIDGIGTGQFGFTFTMKISIKRRGGTELRQVQRGNRRLYAWSGADASGLVLDFGFKICVWNCWGRKGGVSAPMGLGAASAGPMKGGLLRGHENVPDDRYGHGRKDLFPMVWEWPGYPGESLSSQARRHKVAGDYAGLPDYYSLPGEGDGYYGAGFMAPYLIVGVVLDSDRVPSPNTKGRLDMPRYLAGPDGGQVAAIAKARVVFSRPRDLGYFARADGATEQANAFNPYWTAHLVDTLFADRVMALAVQQEERWYPDINLPDIPGVDYDAIANSLGIR